MRSPDTVLWRMGTLTTETMRQSLLDKNGNFRGDLIAGIENYTDEILFLAGECSSLIGPTFQQHQMALFSKARMVVLQDAGHMMFTDQPMPSISAVRAFLTSER